MWGWKISCNSAKRPFRHIFVKTNSLFLRWCANPTLQSSERWLISRVSLRSEDKYYFVLSNHSSRWGALNTTRKTRHAVFIMIPIKFFHCLHQGLLIKHSIVQSDESFVVHEKFFAEFQHLPTFCYYNMLPFSFKYHQEARIRKISPKRLLLLKY